MKTVLTEEQKHELLQRGFSRRTFGRIGVMLTAGATLLIAVLILILSLRH